MLREPLVEGCSSSELLGVQIPVSNQRQHTHVHSTSEDVYEDRLIAFTACCSI